jgi:hypothetical protein
LVVVLVWYKDWLSCWFSTKIGCRVGLVQRLVVVLV